MAPRRLRDRPRSRSHTFNPDYRMRDYAGVPLCTCGSRRDASVHRARVAYVPALDRAALAAGERDD